MLNQNTKITLSFNQLKQLIKESLISEDKTKMINRLVLPDISDEDEKEEYKAKLINFFKSHSNLENKIDWNKVKTLTKKDFDAVFDLANNSKSSQKKEIASDIKNIFKSVGERKFEIVGENEKWLFVAPLTYEAAVYCDSSENQGAGAKWCIGYEEDDHYWNDYISNGSIFVMAFNKKYKKLSKDELQTNLKYMIQKNEDENYHIWDQANEDTGDNLSVVGSEKVIADKMFDKAKEALFKEMEVIQKEANPRVEEILKNVTKIDKDTIPEKYKTLVTKIEIPSNVRNIGDFAFYECSGLTSVTMPNGVTSIGVRAFGYCDSLTSVTIPSSATEISKSAFWGCSGLTSVTIPPSVTSIGEWAFYGCSGLTSITIPDSVRNIGEDAFYRCNNLLTITISKNFNRDLLKNANIPMYAKIKII